MSKTKGNVIDPLDVVDQFGSDALRYSLVTGSTPGQDVPLSMDRIESNRYGAVRYGVGVGVGVSWSSLYAQSTLSMRFNYSSSKDLNCSETRLKESDLMGSPSDCIEHVTHVFQFLL